MLALLYDVHGNLPALEAVIADAEAAGAQGWILGGDYALFGGWPAETVQRLRRLERASWIRGNGERWTADPDSAPENAVVPGAIAFARGALGQETVADLASLPFSCPHDGTLICHGSPLSDVRSFAPEPGDEDAELLDGAGAPRVIFGHTHVPVRPDGGRRSSSSTRARSGCPSTAIRARRTRCWTATAGSSTAGSPTTTGRAPSACRGLGGEWAEIVARRIERATMDV